MFDYRNVINDRQILGIRNADYQELEDMLLSLLDLKPILQTDTVLSSCMSMMISRLHELEPVYVDEGDIEEVVMVYLGKRVGPDGT